MRESEQLEKLQRHYSTFEAYLKRAKKDFELRISTPFKDTATKREFQLLRTLGAGSFGRVLLVRHISTNKLHAMKIMEKENVVKTRQVEHTISEIRMLDAFKFPFVVHMDYFFRDNVYLFLLMPFISGGDMFGHLRRHKRFDEPLTKFYAAQVILALEYIHFLGIVYRDLKPENVLIEKDGYLKIIDLGFCKRIYDQRTYTLCGTPEYLAPEIILSQGYNRSVDWWSLGILIFEMAAGYTPFYAPDPMKTYEKIVAGRFSCPQHFSKALKDLIPGILQVDRSKRLGIMKNGAKDVKGHAFFKSVEYDKILNKKVKPSYKPTVLGEGDTSNFDYYEEEPLRQASENEYAEEFASMKIE